MTDQTSPETASAEDWERRIKEKVWASECLTAGEWVYLVGVFHAANEAEARDLAQTPAELERIAELQYEAGMYQSLYENAIERCALVAEGFDAACNSPRMKLFEEAGLVIAVYKRDGEIGAAIRALADTSTGGNSK
jgi:hypothetical protein